MYAIRSFREDNKAILDLRTDFVTFFFYFTLIISSRIKSTYVILYKLETMSEEKAKV